MYKSSIRSYVNIAVGLITIVSILIFCAQSYNKYAYILTKGNFPYVYMFLDKDLASDSWDPMHIASDYWDANKNSNRIYTENLIKKNIRFQYLPSTLFIPQFVNKFNINKKLFYDTFTYFFVALTAYLVFNIFRSLADRHSLSRSPQDKEFYLFVGILALTVLYFPILQAAVYGNIQIWLNAMFAAATICIIKDKLLISGIFIGFASTIKPQFGLLLIWAILRKKWSFVLGFSLSFGLITLCGIAIFGMDNHLDYLKALSFLSQHGESYHQNQSMNGLLNRIFSITLPDDYANLNRVYLYQPFPPFNPWVYYPTLISSLVIVVICLAFKCKGSHDVILIDFCLASIGLTLSSPVTWIYHYGILLPISAVILWMFHQRLNKSAYNKKLFAFFILCFFLTALSIPFVEYVHHTYLNIAQSYYYFAGLGIFSILYLIRQQLNKIDSSHA